MNDMVYILAGGAIQASAQPWQGGTATNNTQPLTFQLNAATLASGKVSIFVQDDTAVVSGQLTVSGCCIRKP